MTYGSVNGPGGPRVELNQLPPDFGPVGGGAAREVSAEYTSFTKFKQRVDELIRDLKESPAGDKQLKSSKLARGKVSGDGGAWAAAQSLYDQYDSVVKDLEDLSKLLSDSMDAMAIAVVASHQGYENIDVDIRDRVRRIYANTSKHYNELPEGRQVYGKNPDERYEPHQDKPTGGEQQPPTSDCNDSGGAF